MKTAYDYTREFISVLTEIDEKLELKSKTRDKNKEKRLDKQIDELEEKMFQIKNKLKNMVWLILIYNINSNGIYYIKISSDLFEVIFMQFKNKELFNKFIRWYWQFQVFETAFNLYYRIIPLGCLFSNVNTYLNPMSFKSL